MAFHTLNVDDGGGFDLIEESAKYKHDGSAMLAVGLDVGSMITLHAFKREMLRRFRADDSSEHVRFLGIALDVYSTDFMLEAARVYAGVRPHTVIRINPMPGMIRLMCEC